MIHIKLTTFLIVALAALVLGSAIGKCPATTQRHDLVTILADENDCTIFWICVHGFGRALNCPAGLVFNDFIKVLIKYIKCFSCNSFHVCIMYNKGLRLAEYWTRSVCCSEGRTTDSWCGPRWNIGLHRSIFNNRIRSNHWSIVLLPTTNAIAFEVLTD